MNVNIIYVLHCPLTKNPVYVGQSSRGLDRPFEHIKEKSHSLKVNEWVHNLKEIGKEPILVIVENNVPENLLSPKELFWINYYIGKGFLLLNQSSINPSYLESINFNLINIPSLLEDPLADIRNYIKARRKILKLTQPEVCKKAGVGLRFLRELEQDTKTNFNTGSILKVLNILGRSTLSIKNFTS